MFSWSRTGAARAATAVGPGRCRETYQRYAVALYRQVLLHPGDPAPGGPVPGDAIVNERALAAIAGSARVRRPRGTGREPAAARSAEPGDLHGDAQVLGRRA
jgi:hypothetical protein